MFRQPRSCLREAMRLLHVHEKIFHFIFVNDHLLVRVLAGHGIFYGLHHFYVVFAGARAGGALSDLSVFRNFLGHGYLIDKEVNRIVQRCRINK